MKPIYALLPDFVRAQKPFVFREIVRPQFSTDFHFHPECQLVYVVSGAGTRIIGGSVEQFEAGDLTFIGPNVPHVWYSHAARPEVPQEARSLALYINPEVVLHQLKPFTNTQTLADFFRQSERGLCLTGPTREQLVPLLTAMANQQDLTLLTSFLQILQVLVTGPEGRWLNPESLLVSYAGNAQSRVSRLMRFIQDHFRQPITLEETAAMAGLQLHSFCRFFKALTQRTFSEFLNEIRIGFACQLLQQSDLPVTQIAYESGFGNVSYFNRSFKKNRSMTPKEYRRLVQQVNDKVSGGLPSFPV
ncbi:helix-turn-helix domain-containing protein [Larkinella terrae]|uniref:Helix-turn-helix domain-containing protein n=1 Tax=Larkinella terrae TaxID=2025311 RepID=A0A7K0EFB6_9BACT|nr:AraC family transcriptional regulator [Larkinella terrae]MRS60392.1 helix-turn-helix domain-containing protein [Larkinella terrae]